jgi:hypothetical protein
VIEIRPHSPQTAPSKSGLSRDQIPEADFSIFRSIGVDADAHRIFSALTVPEYLEAWIRIPGAAPESLTLATMEGDGYRLDHLSAGQAALSIKGSYLFCHLRKIRLFWQKTSDALCASSIVDFRVRGNFGSSVVELRHTALDSAEELAWYGTLWRRSLEKLAVLLRSS